MAALSGWSATVSEAWIKLNVLSGTLPSQVEVTIDPEGLDVDTYEGLITLLITGAVNSAVQIPVVLEVVEPAMLLHTPASLAYTVVVNGEAATFDLDLSSSNDSTVVWQASTDAEWISLNVLSGTVPSQVQVTLDPTGLDIGTHEGTIRVEAPTAGNSPVEIPVTLTVEAWPLYLPRIQHND
jgi:hypothetical protein